MLLPFLLNGWKWVLGAHLFPHLALAHLQDAVLALPGPFWNNHYLCKHLTSAVPKGPLGTTAAGCVQAEDVLIHLEAVCS